MAEARTKPHAASVADHIAARASPAQQADRETQTSLLGGAPGAPPTMWGASIVGFGAYRYRYASGRTGESCLTGFAIRGRELVVYLLGESERQAALRARLGPHKMGKACLYFKRLADLDLGVLEELVKDSVAETRRRWP